MKESIDARIGRYLAGEMGEQEKAGFQRDLATDQALNKAYLGYLRIWESTPHAVADQWNTDLAWMDFEKQHLSPSTPVRSLRNKVAYWAIAASVLLAIGATFFFALAPSSKT